MLLGLVAEFAGSPTALSVGLGVLCTAVTVALLSITAMRGIARVRRLPVARFPGGTPNAGQ